MFYMQEMDIHSVDAAAYTAWKLCFNAVRTAQESVVRFLNQLCYYSKNL